MLVSGVESRENGYRKCDNSCTSALDNPGDRPIPRLCSHSCVGCVSIVSTVNHT